jgi:hypothetical protein
MYEGGHKLSGFGLSLYSLCQLLIFISQFGVDKRHKMLAVVIAELLMHK